MSAVSLPNLSNLVIKTTSPSSILTNKELRPALSTLLAVDLSKNILDSLTCNVPR
jgi:hypothetical protein